MSISGRSRASASISATIAAEPNPSLYDLWLTERHLAAVYEEVASAFNTEHPRSQGTDTRILAEFSAQRAEADQAFLIITDAIRNWHPAETPQPPRRPA